ncbi:ABC transporter ATP-binding protein [Ruminococcus sp. OA3]|uniref:ABC transporter ATP-binding protein n=1 Tax=Ruminococcus sp. OA3 TaxID=2914164 RepID=UPI001F06D54D|nr:ABC transporter ATP-binding protein [Ruminococcus sp. OA3]MCH1980997.1 ABC transporter ATP-binding protein [Ruminococcus sp. OA3]
MDYILTTNQLTKTYRENTAVSHLNMHVKRGSIYGFLGPNGSGKSTTMKMMMNLVKPTEGSVAMFGRNLEQHSADILRRVAAMIETPAFYGNLSAEQTLQIHCEYMGYYKMEDCQKALELVGLTGTGRKPVRRFSMGMKQRLGIARAILTHPEVLILDEPINGLDPEGALQMRSLLKRLNREDGTTILISSHILSEIEQIADTVGILNKGKLIKEVTMEEVYAMSGSYTELEVTDVRKAGYVLEEVLKLHNYRIFSDSVVRIYEEQLDNNMLADALLKQQVGIRGISARHLTLEEYFHQLIGGDSHDALN